MVFLQSHGIGTSRSVRIFKTYGADAIPLVKENPYRLARDIRGIGFKTADQLAQRLGIPKDSILRARAGISYALIEAVADGHCALPEENLLTLAQELAHPFSLAYTLYFAAFLHQLRRVQSYLKYGMT
jgi:exodeoxyribonuclease V alpha subunit